MAKKRAREADGATEAPDKMVQDSDSSDDEVSSTALEWLPMSPEPRTDKPAARTLRW